MDIGPNIDLHFLGTYPLENGQGPALKVGSTHEGSGYISCSSLQGALKSTKVLNGPKGCEEDRISKSRARQRDQSPSFLAFGFGYTALAIAAACVSFLAFSPS